MPHVSPTPATILACRLAAIRPLPVGGYEGVHAANCLATLATNVIRHAATCRRLGEAGCNAELTKRQETTRAKAKEAADALLHPYGLKLDNPWGLCHYACPIDADDRLSESACIFLA